MCRMLAVRASRPLKVEDMLLGSPTSLKVLSHEHRHGWGLATYVDGAAHVVRGTAPAYADPDYHSVASMLEGQSLLAHIRKASVGEVRIENVHPFRHGRWLFAHNGTVPGFDGVREILEAECLPALRALVRGTTDSERCFALFLTRLAQYGALDRPPVDVAACALASVVHTVRLLRPGPDAILNFLATDGHVLVGTHQGDRELWTSDREGERVLVASEPLSTAYAWTLVPDGGVVGTGPDLRLRRWRMEGEGLRWD